MEIGSNEWSKLIMDGARAFDLDLDHCHTELFAVSHTGQLVTVGGSTPMLQSLATWTSGAGASTGTLTNAPSAGNPTSWIAINDNGVTRHIPAW